MQTVACCRAAHVSSTLQVAYVGVPLAIAQGISIASAPHIVGWCANASHAPKSRQARCMHATAHALPSAHAWLGAEGSCHVRRRYNRMNKPKWTPPKWLFGPAWGVMYAAQSYSGWRVLHQVPLRGTPVLLPCSGCTAADKGHAHARGA